MSADQLTHHEANVQNPFPAAASFEAPQVVPFAERTFPAEPFRQLAEPLVAKGVLHPEALSLIDTENLHPFEHVGSLDKTEMDHLSLLSQALMNEVKRDGLLNGHEFTIGHSEGVAARAKRVAEERQLGSAGTELIYQLGRIHDIGKYLFEPSFINIDRRLTDEEYQDIQAHTIVGALYVVKKAPAIIGQYEQMVNPNWAKEHGFTNAESARGAYDRWLTDILLRSPLFHHRNYDHSGYANLPEPLDIMHDVVQIIHTADAAQAMEEERPYRKSMPPEKIATILREETGRGLQDPQNLIPVTATLRQ